ncbi:PREDICTED: uncharacterized protein LOC108970408 [Bactrocera latifrons]|uniref:uncharacterized protein LOC108970408 n=1 Tax=Bactrocera latifrons TaxID=174628 RepID=UPI0008DE47D1|nr:PREDICTED: uncharacterized protein LOC108970408 [Bactrocera latifrons]
MQEFFLIGKGKTKPFPLMVDIKGCTQVPCDVYKGLNTVVQVHFVSSKANIHTLTAIVTPQLWVILTEDIVYDFQFNVDHYYPEIPATMQLNLVDKDNEVITCFSASIRVRKGTAANSVNDCFMLRVDVN